MEHPPSFSTASRRQSSALCFSPPTLFLFSLRRGSASVDTPPTAPRPRGWRLPSGELTGPAQRGGDTTSPPLRRRRYCLPFLWGDWQGMASAVVRSRGNERGRRRSGAAAAWRPELSR